MKKTLAIVMAFCVYTFGNSQITLTKDASYGSFGTINFTGINMNRLSLGTRYITPDNHVVICPLDNTGLFYVNYMTYDANGNLLSTIHLPTQGGNVSILYADNNTVYPIIDGKLYKYSLTGVLDASFGNNGELLMGSSYSGAIYSTASYLPDGKILVRNQDTLIRYNANGSVDTSYGNNGVVNVNGTSFGPFLNERIDDNYFFENSNGRRKINIHTGSLDSSYGNNGYSVYSNQPGHFFSPYDPEAVTNNFEVYTMLIKPFGNNINYVISRTKIDGNIDLNFGNSGMLSLPQTYYGKELYYPFTLGIDNYNDNVIVPVTIRKPGSETDTRVGLIGYSSNGNNILINSSNVFNTNISRDNTNISIEVKGNYLYLITESTITRYIISEDTLNTKEVTKETSINFNNPFSNELSFHSKEKIKQIEIFDEVGHLVLTAKDKNQLNTSNLNKGVYIIKLTTASNKIISKKAIKN